MSTAESATMRSLTPDELSAVSGSFVVNGVYMSLGTFIDYCYAYTHTGGTPYSGWPPSSPDCGACGGGP